MSKSEGVTAENELVHRSFVRWSLLLTALAVAATSSVVAIWKVSLSGGALQAVPAGFVGFVVFLILVVTMGNVVYSGLAGFATSVDLSDDGVTFHFLNRAASISWDRFRGPVRRLGLQSLLGDRYSFVINTAWGTRAIAVTARMANEILSSERTLDWDIPEGLREKLTSLPDSGQGVERHGNAGHPSSLILALAHAGGIIYGIAYGLISMVFLVISSASVAYLFIGGSATSGDLLTLVLTLSLAIAAVYGLYLAWWAILRRIRSSQFVGADRAALGLAIGNLLPLAFGIELRFWPLVGVAALVGSIYGSLYLLLRGDTKPQ